MKVSKENAQKAWNTVARFLNQEEELSFHISPWNRKGEEKYSLCKVIGNDEQSETVDIFVSNSKRPKKL